MKKLEIATVRREDGKRRGESRIWECVQCIKSNRSIVRLPLVINIEMNYYGRNRIETVPGHGWFRDFILFPFPCGVSLEVRVCICVFAYLCAIKMINVLQVH